MSTKIFRRQWIRWVRASVMCAGSLALAAPVTQADDGIPLPPGIDRSTVSVRESSVERLDREAVSAALPSNPETPSQKQNASAESALSVFVLPELMERDEAAARVAQDERTLAADAQSPQPPQPGTRAHLLHLMRNANQSRPNGDLDNGRDHQVEIANTTDSRTGLVSKLVELTDDVAEHSNAFASRLPEIVPAASSGAARLQNSTEHSVPPSATDDELLLPVIVPSSNGPSQVTLSETALPEKAERRFELRNALSQVGAEESTSEQIVPVEFIDLPAPQATSSLPLVPADDGEASSVPFEPIVIEVGPTFVGDQPEFEEAPSTSTPFALDLPEPAFDSGAEVASGAEVDSETRLESVPQQQPQVVDAAIDLHTGTTTSLPLDLPAPELEAPAFSDIDGPHVDLVTNALSTQSERPEVMLPIEQIRKLLNRSLMELTAGDTETAHAFAEAAAEVTIPFEVFKENPEQVLAEVEFVTQRHHDIAMTAFVTAALPDLPEPATVEQAVEAVPETVVPLEVGSRAYRAIGAKSLNIRPQLANIPGGVTRERITVPAQPARDLARASRAELHQVGTSRQWSPMSYSWEAPALKYNPLYFEDVELERFGNEFQYLQPVVSAAHFYLTIPTLPYQIGTEENGLFDCVYDLGNDRPGNCVPFHLHHFGFSWTGALAQGGAVTGLLFILP